MDDDDDDGLFAYVYIYSCGIICVYIYACNQKLGKRLIATAKLTTLALLSLLEYCIWYYVILYSRITKIFPKIISKLLLTDPTLVYDIVIYNF